MASYLDHLLEVQEMVKERDQYVSLMNEYQRSVVNRAIDQKRAEIRPLVLDAVTKNWNGRINEFQAKKEAYNKQKQAEQARFDIVKLGASIKALTDIVGMVLQQQDNALAGRPSKAKQLKAIFDEEMASGDPNRQRAVLVTFEGALRNIPGNPELAMLAGQAERANYEFRKTEGMKAAAIEVNRSISELEQARNEMIKAGELLGEPTNEAVDPFANGPIVKELRRVQVDSDNQLIVFDATAPEVTGVRMPAESEV